VRVLTTLTSSGTPGGRPRWVTRTPLHETSTMRASSSASAAEPPSAVQATATSAAPRSRPVSGSSSSRSR
jgi:hypothetical protein